MFSRAWLLGIDVDPDPAVTADRLHTKIIEARVYVILGVGFCVGAYWFNAWQAPNRAPMPWGQLSFALCWSVLILMGLVMPNIARHDQWAAARKRFVIRTVWIAAVLLVIAGAWDLALFCDRRWGYYLAWFGLFTGFLIGLFLLMLLGWFTLAGTYFDRIVRCGCPPPMKRWMRTAPLPRNLTGPHRCPRPEGPVEAEAVTEAA